MTPPAGSTTMNEETERLEGVCPAGTGASPHKPLSLNEEEGARRVAFAAFAVLAIALLWQVGSLVAFSLWAIRYPFELDYGEGIAWEHLRLMLSGRAYGPIDGFPAITILYPPVYHMVTAALSSGTGMDQLAAGRTVSLVSILAGAMLGGMIVHRLVAAEGGGRGAVLIGLATSFIMLSSWPLLFWTPVMRVDMLGLAFSFAGLYFATRALERPGYIFAAAVAFVLGVYTKQVMIAAPAASFLVLLFLRPKVAAVGVATCVAMGIAGLVLLNWLTDGRFTQHVFGYPASRIVWWQLLQVPLHVLAHLLYFAVAGWAVVGRVNQLLPRGSRGLVHLRDRVQGDRAAAISLILLVYLAISTPMAFMIGKVGANQNYLIEWTWVVALFVGLGLKHGARLLLQGGSVARPALAIGIVAAVAVQVMILPKDRFDRLPELPLRSEMEELSEMIRAASKPVISDDMVVLLRGGKGVFLESGMVGELGSIGVYDERPFIRKIYNGDFAFFVTFRERGEPTFDSRYNPPVADAIDAAYPRKRQLAGLTLHLPAR